MVDDNVVFVHGMPGSGKTTFARMVAAEIGVPFFGFGDALRSDTSRFARRVIESRDPVSSVELAAYFLRAAPDSGVFEGFPRSLEQHAAIESRYTDATHVLYSVSAEVARTRYAARGRTDQPFEDRLEGFYRHTEPLLRRLERDARLIIVDGEGLLEEVDRSWIS